MGLDKVNWLKKILNYRLPSKLSSKGVKVKTLLIFVLFGLVLTPILSSYENCNLTSIAISGDGSMCAYISNGYNMPMELHVSKSDGTLIFEHKFTSKETGGGNVIIWFEGEKVNAYTLRKNLLITFAKDGSIESKEKIVDFDYPNKYKDFEKGFSTYYFKTDKGEYRYTNVDVLNSFVLRRSRELVFVSIDGDESLIWRGEE